MSRPALALAFAGFAVVSTEFVVVGLLPALARDLGVSIPIAGLLLTLFAAVVAATGPLLTALASGAERRRLFAALLAVFVVANLLAAVAPSYPVMAAARVLAALALPVFWSVAAATAARLAAPGQEGRAVAAVFTGISAATVLGIPAGTLIGEAFGWRASFVVLAALSAVAAVLLRALLPTLPGEQSGGLGALRAQAGILRDGRFLTQLALSAAAFTAMFAAYTFLADALHGAGHGGQATGWLLMLFGGAGLAGNWAAGRIVDRAPLRMTALSVGLIGAAGLLLPWALDAGTAATVGLLALWGAAHAANFLVNQVRVMAAAPAAARAFAASLNVSVCNLGIALGAALGGAVVGRFGIGWVGLAAAGAAVVALGGAALLAARPRATFASVVG